MNDRITTHLLDTVDELKKEIRLLKEYPMVPINTEEWKPVSVRPTQGFAVLTYGPVGMVIAYYAGSEKWTSLWNGVTLDMLPTHWRELPSKPLLKLLNNKG